MHTIGLTGGIGSGKSSVARWFETRGVPVLDADNIVHQLLAADKEIIARLAREFGPDILGADGFVDRRALGRIVFQDEQRRKRLENMLHPQVLAEMERARTGLMNQGDKLCIWDIPLLFESGMDKFVDEVWVVWVPLEIQIERVLQRDKLSREEIMARIQAQLSLDYKASRAKTVIDNSKNWKNTEESLMKLWKRLGQDLNQKK